MTGLVTEAGVKVCPHCGAQMLAWDDECWICPNEPLPVELVEGEP